MNSVSKLMNLFSWMISGIFSSIFCLVSLSLMQKYTIFEQMFPLIVEGNILIVWLIFFVNFIHTVSMGYHISSYFTERESKIYFFLYS